MANLTFDLANDLKINRLGYGAMRLTGEGVWGDPPAHVDPIAILRRAVELGANFIDTADAYGPATNEDQIREALYPYNGIVIATKGGLVRPGPMQWTPCGRPDYLRQCVEMSLRRLKVERIDLWQLHRIDPEVPVADQIGALTDLQSQGKIKHLGLSQVTVDELKQVQELATIVSVQNLYNLVDRSSEDVLHYCEEQKIGFIPWFPVASGDLAKPGGALEPIMAETGHTAAQISLAWLLQKSPVMLPIPGTSSLAHLEENMKAAEITLSDEIMAQLDAISTNVPA
jgi:aryl-alcohol dehydrogenase-like predicted oxidoreductase